MKTLQEHFCLRRPNFQLNPKQSDEDRTLFFGDNENVRIIEEIDTAYLGGDVPRYYLYGNYGTGKTHLLYYLKHHFDTHTDIPILPLVVQVEAQSNTPFQSLHRRFLDAITPKRLSDAYSQFRAQYPEADERERKTAELFPEEGTRHALHFLEGGPALASAWKWLTGEKLTTAEQQGIGVVGSVSATGDLVDLLVGIGELFTRVGTHLLFLVDESESLHNVSSNDAMRSWHDAFRRLAGEDNRSIGWILTFFATDNDEPPAFMREGDIMDRLGDKGVIVREPLAPIELKKFVGDLCAAFVDHEELARRIKDGSLQADPACYPFTPGGYEAFMNEASAAPERAIPRTIIRALTSCAIEALRRDSPLIDAGIVTNKAPQEFFPSKG